MKIYKDLEQGTEEWYAVRRGIATASEFEKLLSPTGKDSSQIEELSRIKGAEKAGASQENFKTDYMNRGNELEDEARTVYSFETDLVVDQVGFIRSSVPDCGASPDGLIGDDGIIEIKCLGMKAFLDIVATCKIPIKYKPQVQGLLMVSDRKWVDMVFYYPNLKLIVERFERDEEYIAKLKERIVLCNKMRDEFYKKLI